MEGPLNRPSAHADSVAVLVWIGTRDPVDVGILFGQMVTQHDPTCLLGVLRRAACKMRVFAQSESRLSADAAVRYARLRGRTTLA
jgi:hypothetical protein